MTTPVHYNSQFEVFIIIKFMAYLVNISSINSSQYGYQTSLVVRDFNTFGSPKYTRLYYAYYTYTEFSVCSHEMDRSATTKVFFWFYQQCPIGHNKFITAVLYLFVSTCHGVSFARLLFIFAKISYIV